MLDGIVDGLNDLVGQLDSLTQLPAQIAERLDDLESASNRAAMAWSGSNIGYHARVYYQGLQPPPSETHFSVEWGLSPRLSRFDPMGTRGDWVQYPADDIRDAIYQQAGVSQEDDIGLDLQRRTNSAVHATRDEATSLLSAAAKQLDDDLLTRILSDVEAMVVMTEHDAQVSLVPMRQVVTRDRRAIDGGLQSAPHQDVLARVYAVRSAPFVAEQLRDKLALAARHIERTRGHLEEGAVMSSTGRVFIGHGGSAAWRDLKDFLKDRFGS